MSFTRRIALAMTGTLILPLAACGVDGPAAEPDAVACVRLQTGPFQQLTAGATRDSSAPVIDDNQIAYRIGLPGFVFFSPAEAGDYRFYLSAGADVELTGPDGAAIAPTETVTGSPSCDEIAVRHQVPLVVGTSFLELGGAGLDEVTIVVEPQNSM